MMKKIICILCVLTMVFLVSCKKEASESDTTTTKSVTEAQSHNDITETTSETSSQSDTDKNKYALTDSRRDSLTEKQYDAYKIIVDAIDSGKTQISVDLTVDENSYDKVKSALWSGYPLYSLIEDMYYYYDTKTLHVKYLESGTKLTSIIDAFYGKVNSIITPELLSKDEFEKSVLLYEYIAGKTPSDDDTLSVYDFITGDKGTDVQFSMAYEYLLNLAGVNCNHAYAEVGNDQIAFTQVKINGNYYYMLPYKEAVDNNGKLLRFFGMNEDRLKASTDSKSIFTYNNEYERVELPKANDAAFDFTEFIESWNLDTVKNELVYKMTDNTFTYKY